MSYEQKRHLMVDEQLRARGIKDERVLHAMEKVERHLFVDEQLIGKAYKDRALPIGEEQTISQPYMVALMTELLELNGNEKVLEIGTGSGYQSAVLSMLASEVYSVERIQSLSLRAKNILEKSQCHNVHVIVSDGSVGLKEHAPYDAIIVTAGAPEISQQLIDQLTENGRLVIPVGSRQSQVLQRIKKGAAGIEEIHSTACIFVPLIGESGWDED